MSSKILTVSIPTFILKKIDPEALIEKYNAGGFQSLTIQKETVQAKNAIKIIGNSIQDPIYSFRDKNNVTHTVATTNCDNYSGISCEKMCEWCRIRFNHPEIGIPVGVKYEPSRTIFYIEGSFCDFPCALAHLLMCKGPSLRFQSIVYSDSETYLRIMYSKMRNTTEILQPAPHYRLWKRNGGSLEDHECIQRTVQYISLPNLILQPVKQQYIKIGVV